MPGMCSRMILPNWISFLGWAFWWTEGWISKTRQARQFKRTISVLCANQYVWGHGGKRWGEECYCVWFSILSSMFPLLVASLEQLQIKVVMRALSAGNKQWKWDLSLCFYYRAPGCLATACPAEVPYSDLTWKFHIYGNIRSSCK